MNCRFCGNFIPENSDSCPVCGRRQDEEPIGKLLSDNLPQNVAAIEAAEAAAQKKKQAGERRKGLAAPLLAVAVSVAGWLYGLSQKVLETFKTIFNGTYGQSAQLGEGSDFAAGSAVSSNDNISMLVIAGLVVLVTIIGIIGVISLFKRMVNNYKYDH
ncbi:MAG: hypothetical protein E7559_09610 [Ruminococcaceae bacterium]|nr:hypothetical protein [Oscillospiraceae bacterium]